MRKLTFWLGGGELVAAMILALGVAPASAGQLYRWTTNDGTVAFSDDAKRVPDAYRARAKRTSSLSLTGYDRLTPADDAARDLHAERLEKRLEQLRAFNATGGAAVETSPPAAHPVNRMDLRSARKVTERRLAGFDRAGRPVYRTTERVRTLDEPVPSVAFAVDPGNPAPVVIERRRVLDDDTNVTRHVTVVEQGGRVLGLIKPRVHAGPVYRETEEELERY
ncbi:MAG: DUF4124 domain-containing protein [Myxococcota bacterium]